MGIVSEPTKFERIHQLPRYTLSSSSVAMSVVLVLRICPFRESLLQCDPIQAWSFGTMYHE